MTWKYYVLSLDHKNIEGITDTKNSKVDKKGVETQKNLKHEEKHGTSSRKVSTIYHTLL